MNDLEQLFTANFDRSRAAKAETLATLLPQMTRAAEAMVASYRAGGKAIF